MAPDPTDIRVLIPRVRRAVEGVGGQDSLADEGVRDLAADAAGQLILYSGGGVGWTLSVTATDETYGAPLEYATSRELTLDEQTVIASQAALNHFFHRFVDTKVSERIADEGREWEWSRSASLLRAQLELLIAERDRALEAVSAAGSPLDAYASFVAVRDTHTSQLIEPWVHGIGGGGGLELDPRFGTWG